MRRIAILLALAAAAGCGQAEQPYTPRQAPVQATGEATEQATPSGSEPPATVGVGDELEVRVAWPDKVDQLVRLFPEFYADSWAAVVSGGDRYLRHVEPTLIPDSVEWVAGFTGKGQSVKGVVRLYDLKTTVMGKGAQVDVCVDETRMTIVSADTGKAISPQPDSSRAPYLQTMLAHRGDDGVWRIRQFSNSKEGCSP
ncbi:hypothetical protein ACBI99_12120 [Nonomuraea sp. ATR24]|uniref:hypothetical protein n=1 Tax=Nonomuraea TaxID=83681 RepID=UPI001C5D4A0B|nr:hypothetical protein [Nonomuraea ceibae]